MNRRVSGLFLLLPLVLAIVFVGRFASPLPLTDEWTYTHALRLIAGLDLHAPDAWQQLWSTLPFQHSEHWVIVPFLFYAPVAELFDFDSRWIIGLTLAAFAAQAWAYRRAAPGSRWTMLPIVALLYGPAHYMEFLWGWQFTLTLSALLPLLGLVLLDALPPQPSLRRWSWSLAGAVALFLLGTLSSAGGFFGFPAALVLLALKPLPRCPKFVALSALIVVGAVAYVFLMAGNVGEVHFGLRPLWVLLTAIGGALLGTPVGLTEFGFDTRSGLGLIVVALSLTVLLRALRLRQVHHLALPLAFATFGFLCVLPIALVRPYLGNWHLQYILPVLAGGYLAALKLWQHDQSRWARAAFAVWVLVLGASVWGTVQGFRHYGPTYRDYTRPIEQFVWDRLTIPGAGAPYPAQNPERDLDLNLILFLAAKGNPLFDRAPATTRLEDDLPTGTRFWLDGTPTARPTLVADFPPGSHLIAVGIPDSAGMEAGVEVQAGKRRLRLWRVHAGHVSTTEDLSAYRTYAGYGLPTPPLEPTAPVEFILLR